MSKEKVTKQHQPKPTARIPKPLPSIHPAAVIGMLGVLLCVFYSGHLFGSSFLWEDFVEQEFPFRTYAATSLANGVIPHWNPYTFCGMPFLADLQTAFWYPANMLQALFVSGDTLSPVVMQWFIILHYLVAGVGMFILVRKVFKTDDWSALFSAAAYMFCGYMTGQIIHQMIIYHLALFPFVVYLFISGFDSWKHSVAAGLLLGVMYLAGHPQATLYLSFFLACLALYELGYRLSGKNEQTFDPSLIARIIIPALIGFGIFAVQYFPSQELAALSLRNEMTFDHSVSGGQLGWSSMLTFIMPRLFGLTDAMHQAVIPYWKGDSFMSWEAMIYIGILPLVFGLAAGIAGFKKKYVGFFFVMSVFAVLFSLGEHFFLYKLFFSFPFFDKLRTPVRMMMAASFALCALGGVGMSMYLNDEFKGGMKKLIPFFGILFFVGWLVAIAGIITPTSVKPDAPIEVADSFKTAAGSAAFFVIASVIVCILAYLRKLQGMTAAMAIIGITVIELLATGMSVNKSDVDPRNAFNEQPQAIQALKEDQAKELSRANIRMSGAMVMKRNQGPYDRIQLLEGYNPLVLAGFAPVTTSSQRTMDMMNIKWRIQGQGFGPVASHLPRAKMYYSLDVKPTEEAKNTLKTDSLYDYYNRLLLEEQPSLTVSSIDPNPTVQIKRYEANEIEVAVKTSENGMLFLSEVNYPAWKATIDGKETKIFRAFTSLRAIEVPKGEHTVILRYESDAFAKGSMITLVTLVISLGALGWLTFASRKKKAEA